MSMILSTEALKEYLRFDDSHDTLTLQLLIDSAVDIIEHQTGRVLKGATDVPAALNHAICVFVAANFDDRAGASETARRAIENLCQPFWEPRL